MLLRLRATINYSILTRYSRQYSTGRLAINLHVRNRPGLQIYILTPDRAPSYNLCAVPAKTDPPRHFQGWSFQSHRTGQYRPHPPPVQKNPLHDARNPTYQPWTGHLQGCTKQWTQRPSPGAHVRKPGIRPAPSPQPKRPSAGIQPSSFKV